MTKDEVIKCLREANRYGEANYDAPILFCTNIPIINCGTNENLFLALAALRDDSDKNQWFISDKTKQFYKCISDKFDFHEASIANMLCWDNTEHFRKASVEEIIEHFKDK